ncbi:MAG TPA: hypothetical protein VNW29_03345 [Candidatus Sulfotelmatobacter sp.]|jgi:hypothetical protein|nr:hypothetical protein [Candidatus Sulfotelmatobacter sp.]
MSKTTELRQQTFTAPAAAENTSVLAAQTLPASGTTVVTAGITNPDVPRTVRLKGNQATVQGLQVIVTGTDIQGNALSETVTMGNAFATPTDTVNAFATVISVTLPTRGASGDTISFGKGAALGLDSYCDQYSFSGFGGVTSYTYSTTVIARNTITLSATLDGATNQAVNYIPNTFPTYGRAWG